MRPIYLVSKTSHHNVQGVIHLPVLTVRFLSPPINFSLYDGIIITSKEGAKALGNYEIEWEKFDILCVGESTAAFVRALGGCNITVAGGYGDSILEILENQYNRWLYLRPRAIASSWPKQARVMGKKIDEVIVYETTCNEKIQKCDIAEDGILIFTSPSGIECFLKHNVLLPTQSIIVIGKTTQNALPSEVKSHQSKETSVASCIDLAFQIAEDSSPF